MTSGACVEGNKWLAAEWLWGAAQRDQQAATHPQAGHCLADVRVQFWVPRAPHCNAIKALPLEQVLRVQATHEEELVHRRLEKLQKRVE